MKAIDASFSLIPESAFHHFKVEGYDLFIQGLWTALVVPGNPLGNLRAAKAAGLKIAAYIAINGSRPGNEHVDKGRDAAGDLWEDLEFVAVDVEVVGIQLKHIQQAIARVQSLNQRPVIYTGRWFWIDRLGNPQTFARYPLWTADYDGKPVIEPPGYGGWVKAVGKQYQGSMRLHGVTVDLNVFRDDFFQEDSVTPPNLPRESLVVVRLPTTDDEKAAALAYCNLSQSLGRLATADEWRNFWRFLTRDPKLQVDTVALGPEFSPRFPR